MGRLILPSSGWVYADASMVLYSTNLHPIYSPLSDQLWDIQQGRFTVSSELTLVETLVAPLRDGDAALAADREALWQQSNTRLLPISQIILREAVQLRADVPGLKTPDAIHAATALYHGCALFVTNDSGFRRLPQLPLVLLDDVLTSP